MGRGEVGGRLLQVLIRKVAQLRPTRGSAFALDKEGPRRHLIAARSFPKSTASLSLYPLHFSIFIINSPISQVHKLAPYRLYTSTSKNMTQSILDAKSQTDPPTRSQQNTLLMETVSGRSKFLRWTKEASTGITAAAREPPS
jgi:hypothetical protein